MKEERSIQSLLYEVRQREQEELRTAVMHHGRKEKEGYEYKFGPECPIIAAYIGDEPADVVILSVRMDKEGHLTIIGEEKLDRTISFELDPDKIFAGQLRYVTGGIA